MPEYEEDYTLDFKSDLAINRLALDDEWDRQPRLTFLYGGALADAIKDHETAKKDMEVTKADLNLQIRGNPAYFGLTKITEKLVEHTVTTSEGYVEAWETYIKARREVEFLKGAVKAMDSKKAALENLVRLFLTESYSEPKIRQEYKETTKEETRETVRDQMRKKGKPTRKRKRTT